MKRAIKFILGLIALSTIALVAYSFYFHALIALPIERYRARRVLAHTATQDLDTAVGRLGTVLHFRDGSWLAIRYQDSHAFPTWSLAVARDSGGEWFESSYHFCGSFVVIRDLDAIAPSPDDAPPPPNDPPKNHAEWIRLLAASPDLSAARQRMGRYFHQVP